MSGNNLPKETKLPQRIVDEDEVDFSRILSELVGAQVEFLVVGGFAVVLHGVVHSPPDLDLVYRRTQPNVRRLMRVFQKLDGVFLGDENDLMGSSGTFQVPTSYGNLDVLAALPAGGLSYEDLVPHSADICASGHRLKVLGLPLLISIKERLDRPEDRALLPLLREALRQDEKDLLGR